MRRLALLLLLVPALLALPAGSQPVPEGGGGGDCPQGSNTVLATEADPDLANPSGIDVAPDGGVWVSDSNTTTVHRFTRAGDQTLAILAGDATPGLQNPVDVVAADDGHVWVVDDVNNRVYRFNGSGDQDLTIPAASGQPDFADPSSLALNAAGTRLWVLDSTSDTLQRFDTATGAHTLTVPLTNADPDPDFATGLAVDRNGNVTFADSGLGHRVHRFDPTGEQNLVIEPTAGSPELETPRGVAYDTAGNLIVLDASTSTFQRFGPAGTRQFVVDGVVNGGLEGARDVAVGTQGDLWATDTVEDTVMRWCFRVDVKLRRGSGAFVGDTTVNRTGAGQVLNATVGRNVTTNFTLRIDGESNARHRTRVKAPAVAGVRFFNGAQNVTAAVNGAGFVTPFVEPGFHRDLRFEVRTSVARTITIRTSSEAAPARIDAVKLAVRTCAIVLAAGSVARATDRTARRVSSRCCWATPGGSSRRSGARRPAARGW
jgi:sugar lactone lactonase YvrE